MKLFRILVKLLVMIYWELVIYINIMNKYLVFKLLIENFNYF